jgi:hypothetical protein
VDYIVSAQTFGGQIFMKLLKKEILQYLPVMISRAIPQILKTTSYNPNPEAEF